ncbi:hypothetical protein ACQEV4_42770 [Streptomyces shenzhenensis]|uniref:hypothetical protein n=1 Tax=Streptomyces shenzhenensis TaxID=943815 RepID=UPI003D95049D
MALGTPVGPTQSQWTITAVSVLTVGQYTVPFEIRAVPDNPDADGVEAVVQKFVDLIAASGDFTVSYAGRTYGYQQRMTPTE